MVGCGARILPGIRSPIVLPALLANPAVTTPGPGSIRRSASCRCRVTVAAKASCNREHARWYLVLHPLLAQCTALFHIDVNVAWIVRGALVMMAIASAMV